MSVSTLNRFLKEHTGKTFVDLLHSVRIRHATELLRSSPDTVIGIGYSVGFETQKAFFAAFKKVMGVTPKQWRDNYK
jgi:AraC-type DNA-binding domain-containing proteins